MSKAVLEEILSHEIFSDEYKESRKTIEQLNLVRDILEKAKNSSKNIDKEIDDALIVLNNILITKKNAKIQSVQKKIDSLIVRSRVHFEKITSDSDTETDSESDEEELNANFLEKVIELVTEISKAKLFTKKIDTIVKKCESRKMSDVLKDIKNNLKKSVTQFKKQNDDKAYEIIDNSLVDLEHCYKVVDDEDEEQMFLIKDCLHDILELFDCDDCEQNIEDVSLKGIEF
jgi:hypothetical protein